jgi:hypothetical protein
MIHLPSRTVVLQEMIVPQFGARMQRNRQALCHELARANVSLVDNGGGTMSEDSQQTRADINEFLTLVIAPVIILSFAQSNPAMLSLHALHRQAFFHFPVVQTGWNTVYRRKLNRAWETLRSMPMPAIASDRLVDLHNDLTHYDLAIATQVREFLRGNAINPYKIRVDQELDEALRTFKPESAAEIECRRDLLRYKRRIDDVVNELTRRLTEPHPAVPHPPIRQSSQQPPQQPVQTQVQQA